MVELIPVFMFIAIFAFLLLGIPVAFVLAGISLIFAVLGNLDAGYLASFPNRIYGVMSNDILITVPIFIFMGVTLERSKIAEELLEMMGSMLSSVRSGMGISVVLVGALLAASTGIVGATVVTMGLISLPTMLKNKYPAPIATGAICAAGTLGQIIPPSIVLILLSDQISSAFQTASMQNGTSGDPVSVADIFIGALIPGLLLVAAYIGWIIIHGLKPTKAKTQESFVHVIKVLTPPLLLIFVVLGSIIGGIATPTESASVGAVGAMLIAKLRGKLNWDILKDICQDTAKTTSMIFTILLGAAMFSLVFRGFGGDDLVHHYLSNLPGGLFGAMFVTMLFMFVLGFFLDFIEIIYIVVPIVAPILLLLGADPVWLAIMIAINLQTSFLTPPFGFALFYLRGVASKSVLTSDIYKGIIPFVAIQIAMLAALAAFPALATWLPDKVYGSGSKKEIILELEAHQIDW